MSMKMTTSMTRKFGSDLCLRGLAQLHGEVLGPCGAVLFDIGPRGVCKGVQDPE